MPLIPDLDGEQSSRDPMHVAACQKCGRPGREAHFHSSRLGIIVYVIHRTQPGQPEICRITEVRRG